MRTTSDGFRRVFALIWSFCFAAAALAGTPPSAPVRILRSDELTVEVMDPAHPDRYYRAERFSPVANVLRVRLRGVDYLYAPEQHDPLTDNGGLAMEFDNAKFGPPGFVEARIGEGFLKIGVGVLRKADDLYHYGKRQEIIAPAPTTATWGPDRADFRQVCEGTNGYAYLLESSVRVSDRSVSVTYRLRNTGTKTFATRHYAHNFFSLGQSSIGGGFEVEFPFDFDPVGEPAAWHQSGRTIVIDRTVDEFANITVPILYHYLDENRLVVRHRPSGREIIVTTSIPGAFNFIHLRPAYISPEQFVILKLAPGDTAEWARRYDFQPGPADIQSADTVR